ncbi:hypothetical protein Tco_0834618, partial [Tanacetum coccineum]
NKDRRGHKGACRPKERWLYLIHLGLEVTTRHYYLRLSNSQRVQSNVDQTMVGKRKKTVKMKEGGLTRFKDRPSPD